jgi:phosphatidate phosphatase LPIN
MNILGRFVSRVSDFYKDINPATLSGAIDVVVVEDENGNLSCSPFHVRFGKFWLRVFLLRSLFFHSLGL